MLVTTQHVALLATARLATMSLVAGALDHWIITQAPAIAAARLDPIVSPGAVSGHVHNIMGASNFNNQINDPSVQQEAACTSLIVGADKSNYWAPHLYYRYENDTYAPLLSQSRIYYFTKGGNVTAFPPALRMITGLGASRNASDPKSLGILISCDGGEQTKYLPTYESNPGGCSTINMGIFFPSCGLASGDLDSSDHFSHMAWPLSYNGTQPYNDANGATCPDSHPIKYPSIFYEVNYVLSDDQPWRNDDNVLVLAHGDSTGLSYHADFVNGWDATVLEDAIDQCGSGTNGPNPADNPSMCAPLAPSVDQDAAFACRLEGTIPDEDVGWYRPLDALPGCNPLWTSDMSDKKPSCTSTSSPAFVGPNAYFQNLLMSMHIPMAFTLAENTSLFNEFIPSVGNSGASSIKVWGDSGGSDDSKVTVGTLEEILAGLVDSQGSSSASAASSAVSAAASSTAASSTDASSTAASSTDASSTAASSTTSASTTALANAAVAVVASETSSSNSSASSLASVNATSTADAASTTATGKTCVRRRKRSLLERDAAFKGGAKGHRSKRSKKALLKH